MVLLTSQPTADVRIPLSSNDPGEGTINLNSLTFTPGNWDTPRIVTIRGVDDDVDDGNQNYFVITAAAISGDPLYNGRNPANVGVTNIDDDTAGISVSAISGNTTEAGGTADFSVVLDSQPTANVLIGLSGSDPGEGSVPPGPLTFTPANWDAPQTVTVTGVDDFVDDGDQAYLILTSASSGDPLYAAIDPADVAATNLDDDGVGVTVTPANGPTNEAGAGTDFSFVLDSQPLNDVSISFSSSDPTEGSINAGTITFTPANWNQPQTIANLVIGVDDDVDDGDQSYVVNLSLSR